MKETKVKKELKNQKGITLIALVITIIVLLILAGVSIATLTGENGILTQAESAREQTIIAEEKEAVLIAYTECQMNSRQSSVTEGELETALKTNGKNVTVELEEEELIITFLETNNKYRLTETGGVEYKRPLTAEEANMIVSVGAINEEYIYVETAEGKVKLVENTEQMQIEKIDTKDAIVITENGIRKIGDNYLIDKKGKVYTWGINNSGQLGNGTTEESSVPICISDIEGSVLKGKNITSIVSDWGAIVAIDNEGKVYTWGHNFYGELGNGTTENSNVPICISDIEGSVLKGKNITSIELYNFTVMAKDSEGKIYAWGMNVSGSFGNGTWESSNVPICISDIEGSVLKGKNIVEILWQGTVIAIDNEGKVYTWGSNLEGDLGNGGTQNSNIPICISDIENSELKGRKIVSIESSSRPVIVKDSKGKIYTWGGNRYGQVGNGTTEDSNIPICISDIEGSVLKGKNITSIESDGYSVIAKDNEGKVYTWGENDYRQLGNGGTENSSVPICISDIEGSALKGKNITDIKSYSSTVIAKDDKGKLYTWGYNYYGQLGNGTTEDSSVPICISDIEGSVLKGKNITSIEMDWSSVVVIDNEGKLYAWGGNDCGQFGNGTTEGSSVPICISDIENIVIKDKSIKFIKMDIEKCLIVYISTDGLAYRCRWEFWED